MLRFSETEKKLVKAFSSLLFPHPNEKLQAADCLLPLLTYPAKVWLAVPLRPSFSYLSTASTDLTSAPALDFLLRTQTCN